MSKKFTISQRALGVNDNDWEVLMAIIKPVISAYVMPDATKAAIADAKQQAKIDALRESVAFLRNLKIEVPHESVGPTVVSIALMEIETEE